MKGLVIKNTGSSYVVRTDDGQQLNCIVKGNFRLKGIRSTNPVAVGDRVVVSDVEAARPKSQASNLHFITEIEDRRNYIIRRSQNLSKQSHILAANVDQAMLVVTINRPQTSTTFIDRFLASAEAYRVPVVLLFNKTDLLDEDERRYQELMVTLYETVGYECRQISATTGLGVEELRPLLAGKITLLSGNSGVGKSTLINRLVPGVNLRTAEISDAHNQGMHTTTFSEMIPLAKTSPGLSVGGGLAAYGDSARPSPPLEGPGELSYLIDTPGIKGFGTFDMEPEELTSYFRDIFRFAQDCRFSNCTHTHEPGCAVLKALDEHFIAQSRYQSYLSMLTDKDEGKYREGH